MPRQIFSLRKAAFFHPRERESTLEWDQRSAILLFHLTRQAWGGNGNLLQRRSTSTLLTGFRMAEYTLVTQGRQIRQSLGCVYYYCSLPPAQSHGGPQRTTRSKHITKADCTAKIAWHLLTDPERETGKIIRSRRLP